MHIFAPAQAKRTLSGIRHRVSGPKLDRLLPSDISIPFLAAGATPSALFLRTRGSSQDLVHVCLECPLRHPPLFIPPLPGRDGSTDEPRVPRRGPLMLHSGMLLLRLGIERSICRRADALLGMAAVASARRSWCPRCHACGLHLRARSLQRVTMHARRVCRVWRNGRRCRSWSSLRASCMSRLLRRRSRPQLNRERGAPAQR